MKPWESWRFKSRKFVVTANCWFGQVGVDFQHHLGEHRAYFEGSGGKPHWDGAHSSNIISDGHRRGGLIMSGSWQWGPLLQGPGLCPRMNQTDPPPPTRAQVRNKSHLPFVRSEAHWKKMGIEFGINWALNHGHLPGTGVNVCVCVCLLLACFGIEG